MIAVRNPTPCAKGEKISPADAGLGAGEVAQTAVVAVCGFFTEMAKPLAECMRHPGEEGSAPATDIKML